jgi:hydroxyethylthiazole kinase-like sugar kinase family protein
MNYLVLSPFTGASVASFATRANAAQFASELNAAECAEIARHNAEQKRFCEQFRAPFVPQVYSVCEPESHSSESFALRSYSL